MSPRVKLSGLQKPTASEHALRFLFGGVVTVCTGLIAHHWGPRLGGLFLAFPAILPATLTLVQQHDGRRRAVENGRGARLGAIALIVFAAVAYALAPRVHPALALIAATAVWLLVAASLWALTYGRSSGKVRRSARPSVTARSRRYPAAARVRPARRKAPWPPR